MRALASYIMRGPFQAVLVTAALAMVSLIPVLGAVSILSGATVALATMRHGAKQGLMVIFGASTIAGIFMYISFGSLVLTAIFSLLLWLPLWGLALVLRSSSSWSKVLDTATIIGVVGICMFYLVVPDPVQFWQETLSQMLVIMSEQGGTDLPPIEDQLSAISEWITGMLAAALVISYISSMAVARWWQAMLFNPGGFKVEFQALRLGRNSTFGLMAIVVLSSLNFGSISALASDALMIVFAVYSIVGLAIVHAVVAITERKNTWLYAVYLFLFFLPPQAMMVLAFAGVFDTWLDFRGRLSASGKNDGDSRHDK